MHFGWLRSTSMFGEVLTVLQWVLLMICWEGCWLNRQFLLVDMPMITVHYSFMMVEI